MNRDLIKDEMRKMKQDMFTTEIKKENLFSKILSFISRKSTVKN